MDEILKVDGLCRSFGEFQLKDISISLPRGYIMGFIGPNGAGKTTTIKLIMNLINRDRGEVLIFGKDNIKNEKEIKQRIGFVYDENYYYDFLTLKEMKNIIAPFYRDWDEAVYQRYLKIFELPARKKIKDLSRGMKMKFSLALALSHGAELIIMDEPTSGLDPVFRSELLDILRSEIQDDNRGILFSSHITSDLERIADYICFINNGQIVFSQTCYELREKYLLVKGPLELLNETVRQFMLNVKENDFGFEGLSDQPEKIRRLLGNHALYEVPSLDQIVLYTVRRDKCVAFN
ncbi:MAG: ABC transporter ATP-binding protein [Syntrophomonadaceae bacterium]